MTNTEVTGTLLVHSRGISIQIFDAGCVNKLCEQLGLSSNKKCEVVVNVRAVDSQTTPHSQTVSHNPADSQTVPDTPAKSLTTRRSQSDCLPVQSTGDVIADKQDGQPSGPSNITSQVSLTAKCGSDEAASCGSTMDRQNIREQICRNTGKLSEAYGAGLPTPSGRGASSAGQTKQAANVVGPEKSRRELGHPVFSAKSEFGRGGRGGWAIKRTHNNNGSDNSNNSLNVNNNYHVKNDNETTKILEQQQPADCTAQLQESKFSIEIAQSFQGSFQCKSIRVNNPYDIWCQRKDPLPGEIDRMCQVEGYSRAQVKDEDVIAGNYYLARIRTDADRFYRVRVQNVEDNRVEIFAVDTGFTGRIHKKYLKEMPEHLMHFPGQAFSLKLSHVKPAGGSDKWTKTAIEAVRAKELHLLPLKVEIEERLEERRFLGSIILTSTIYDEKLLKEVHTEKTLAEYIIELGMGIRI